MKLQGTLPLHFTSAQFSEKLCKMLREHQDKGMCFHTFGSLDPAQVVQIAKYLTTVYVSGWQGSSTASTSSESGPDGADYPYVTVPNEVGQLFRAQLSHDRKQFEECRRMSSKARAKCTPVNNLSPIIADADTGHGGLTATMKLTKMFIENGAPAVSDGVEMRPTSCTEDSDFVTRCKAMSAWRSGDRFKHTVRPYKVEDAVKLRGTLPLHFTGAQLSDKLHKMLREHQVKGTCSHTSPPGILRRSCRWRST